MYAEQRKSDHRIIESFRLEETIKIIEPNHQSVPGASHLIFSGGQGNSPWVCVLADRM